MEIIKYIKNDPNKGILYDWDKIRKRYRELNIPPEFFDPLPNDFNPILFGYFFALSDRIRGKTSETLILSLLMYDMYGTVSHYLRCDDDTIKPKMLSDLFATIREFGYIEKITDGRWNDVYYYGQKWYLCLRDETGKIIEDDKRNFLRCMSLNQSDELKSSYNCPRGDIMIFDEFIQLKGYGYNDFIKLHDIISTVFRKRISPIVYMLSNTIDFTSPWFDEFCIRDDVDNMIAGESRTIETEMGTHIRIDVLENDKSIDRQETNRRFFGFPNPKLGAITGKGVWATESYQHIPSDYDAKMDGNESESLLNKLFLKQSGRIIRLELVRNSIGLCVYVRPATRTYSDSIILTAGEITEPREVFGFGADGSLINAIWRLYRANRFYYATNKEGCLVAAYIKFVKAKLQHMGL